MNPLVYKSGKFIIKNLQNPKRISLMENTQTSKPVWIAPDLKVFEVNDLTLGAGAAGIDFGSEISA